MKLQRKPSFYGNHPYKPPQQKKKKDYLKQSNPRSIELKSFETGWQGQLTQFDLTWSAYGLRTLNGISAGDSDVARTGRSIRMRKLSLNWSFAMTPGTVSFSTNGGAIRMKVVYDRQSNKALPAVTDIFLTDSFNSFNNLNNSKRFVTIMDIITPPISQFGDKACAGKKSVDLDLEAIYEGSGGAITNITTGSLILGLSQNAFIRDVGPTLRIDTRLRFTDA